MSLYVHICMWMQMSFRTRIARVVVAFMVEALQSLAMSSCQETFAACWLKPAPAGPKKLIFTNLRRSKMQDCKTFRPSHELVTLSLQLLNWPPVLDGKL